MDNIALQRYKNIKIPFNCFAFQIESDSATPILMAKGQDVKCHYVINEKSSKVKP